MVFAGKYQKTMFLLAFSISILSWSRPELDGIVWKSMKKLEKHVKISFFAGFCWKASEKLVFTCFSHFHDFPNHARAGWPSLEKLDKLQKSVWLHSLPQPCAQLHTTIQNNCYLVWMSWSLGSVVGTGGLPLYIYLRGRPPIGRLLLKNIREYIMGPLVIGFQGQPKLHHPRLRTLSFQLLFTFLTISSF